MHQEIWKFPTVTNEDGFRTFFSIEMPKGAQILCVQSDEKTNIPCIWALVNPKNDIEPRYFDLFGTGQKIPIDRESERKYIGTYQYQKGQFVGHLFESILI